MKERSGKVPANLPMEGEENVYGKENVLRIPEKHRDFHPSQLTQLESWDRVMREMEHECEDRMFHLATGTRFFDDLSPDYSSHCCPCFVKGQILNMLLYSQD